jgi:hypothetical protein
MNLQTTDGSMRGDMHWQIVLDPESDCHLTFDSKAKGEIFFPPTDNKYSLAGHLFASDVNRTLQMSIALNSRDQLWISQEFFLFWDVSNPDHGWYQVTSTISIGGISIISLSSEFRYAHNVFSGSTFVHSSQSNSLAVDYEGQYYGNSSQW